MAKHRAQRQPIQIRKQLKWLNNKWRYFTWPRIKEAIQKIDRLFDV